MLIECITKSTTSTITTTTDITTITITTTLTILTILTILTTPTTTATTTPLYVKPLIADEQLTADTKFPRTEPFTIFTPGLHQSCRMMNTLNV